MAKKVFAFDLGKASIGYCVREGFEILKLGSIIIPPKHAETETARKIRRMHRQIDSHKAREEYFNKIWEECGQEVLAKTDKRFTKEFGGKNDNTIYTSCLLRIALLQEKPLEKWQIYKALHNAIQRRGYDVNVPWKTNKTDEDKYNEELVKQYTRENDIELINSDKYKYPCYYDALRLGLWLEDSPQELKSYIPHYNYNKVRQGGYVSPRQMVEDELSLLWRNAQKQIPELNKISVEEFLYGESGTAYASAKILKYQKYRGKEKDKEGVLSQKLPRFDNRIISKCKLLPKRNVCRADDLDNIVFTLLKQLKDLRYINCYQENGCSLTAEQIKAVYDLKISTWKEFCKDCKRNNKNHDFTITHDDLKKVLGKDFALKRIEKMQANTSGRSSFCRRACQIMNEIIMSGKNPLDIDISKFVDNPNTKNGITEEEIKTMLSKIGTWDKLYIPDNRNEENENSQKYINADINTLRQETDKLIGKISNPIVRNRLQIFRDLLFKLKDNYQVPDAVIFEFVRDDKDNTLLSYNKARNLEDYYAKSKKDNEEIKETLGEDYSKRKLEMMKLLKFQKYKCIYSGRGISSTDLDACQIDHIYPWSSDKRTDAMYNKVVCYASENSTGRGKGNRTPYQWFKEEKTEDEWNEYITRVANCTAQYPKPKKNDKNYYTKMKEYELAQTKYMLLTCPPEMCEEIIDNKNGLSETGYIARIAQRIVAFVFGFGLQVEGKDRKIFVNSGSLTHRMLNYYGLEKDRSNPKHHAQDAIMISFSQMFQNDRNKHKTEIQSLCEKELEKMMPYHYTNDKPLRYELLPNDTMYAKRKYNNETDCLTEKTPIKDIKYTQSDIEKILDLAIRKDLLSLLKYNYPTEKWLNILEKYKHPLKKTKVKNVRTKLNKKYTLTFDNNGKERFGNYADFGNNTKGQFKYSQSNTGQIVYYNADGKIKLEPIYANLSKLEAMKKVIDKNGILYERCKIIRTGIEIIVEESFTAEKKVHPAGRYYMNTIRTDGRIELRDGIGNPINTKIEKLVQAKFSKYKD